MALWSNRGLGTTCLILSNESVARLEAGGCRNQGTYETVVGWREYVYRVWRVYAREAVLIAKWHTRNHALTYHTVPAFFIPAEQGQDVEADALCTQAIDRIRSRICYHFPLHTTPARPLTNVTAGRTLGHWMPWMQQARAAAGRVADDSVCQISYHG
jgi:hypothetical protein